ncbi:AAA family ATPase [Actinoplanes sp. NPDC048796]|uniref:AAA family ATPase n=1 Tax=unclassified Actinoplanes TaxID=2626549 RepID=UPI00340942E5
MTQLELDREIAESLDRILAAGRALLTFYEPARKAFIRDTVAVDGDDAPVLGKTSTCRAFIALVELNRLLAEEERPTPHGVGATAALRDEIGPVIRSLADDHFGALAGNPSRVRESQSNGYNMFTDAQVLLSTVLIGNARPPVHTSADLREPMLEIWRETEERLREWEGGKITGRDPTHDFITLHAVRAGDAVGLARDAPQQWWPELSTRVRRSILVQLGRHSAGITSQFDPAELAFSVALLHRFESPDYRPIVDRSLAVIAGQQTEDGSWPSSRMISAGGGPQLLFVASFEVALTLAELLIGKLDRGDLGGIDVLLSVLRKALQLVENTFMRSGSRSGWCNDRARSPGRLESWATAVVLQFLIRYRDALVRLRQERVLSRYNVAFGHHTDFPWPDLALTLGVLTRPDEQILERVSDPTDAGNLARSLRRHFIEPVNANPVQRPAATSLLLPGPPGTRKTSLVQLVARTLDWPLLTLTPADFLRQSQRDLDVLATDSLFSDLMRLRRVVVHIAQCEDALRRPSGPESLSRRSLGNGLFNRLHQLRQNRWVLVFTSPNELREKLDPRVANSNHFDFVQEMHNPPLVAQRRYYKSRTPDPAVQTALERALSDYAGRGRNNNEPDRTEVTFALLDDLMGRIKEDSRLRDSRVLLRLIQQLAVSGPPDLPLDE